MAFLELTNSSELAIVDDGLEEVLSNFTWSLSNSGYVVANVAGVTSGLHRIVMGIRLKRWLEVDHADCNKLNNQRANLRLCNRSQNLQNRPSYSKTGFKGVYSVPSGRYMASVPINRKSKYIGTYDTPEEAARAYDKAAKELHGEFARLNFPEASA